MSVQVRLDAGLVDRAYAKLGAKGARNLIRRSLREATAPIRTETRRAWESAPFVRRGRKLTRKAIAKCITLKPGRVRSKGGALTDAVAVGIDYANKKHGLRQRVAHLLERGRRASTKGKTKTGAARAFNISNRINVKMAGPALEAFRELVTKGVQRGEHD